MLEDHLRCPFQAQVIGEEVTVLGFEREDSFGEILAQCKRGKRTYSINVTALEWSAQFPKWSEWIEAYRAWRRGGWYAGKAVVATPFLIPAKPHAFMIGHCGLVVMGGIMEKKIEQSFFRSWKRGRTRT